MIRYKCHVIIVTKSDLSSFVARMQSGTCKHYVESQLRLPICLCPHALGQQNPLEPTLSVILYMSFKITLYYDIIYSWENGRFSRENDLCMDFDNPTHKLTTASGLRSAQYNERLSPQNVTTYS